MKTKTTTPTLNSSSSALRTSTSWETASRKCWKVKCLVTKTIPRVLCLISAAAERSSRRSVWKRTACFLRLIRVQRFSTLPERRRTPCCPCGFRMHSCRQDAAAVRSKWAHRRFSEYYAGVLLLEDFASIWVLFELFWFPAVDGPGPYSPKKGWGHENDVI